MSDKYPRDPIDLHPLCPRCRTRLIVIPARPRTGYRPHDTGPRPSGTHCDGCGWRAEETA